LSIPAVESRRFTVGKYDVVAKPIPYSAHMLRYTVFVDGTRIGAMASMPSESDCRFMEKPPVVPPLVPYQAVYRPGRPKKGTPPRAAADAPAPMREELPHGMSFPATGDDR
jgi:hypothetical protein